VLFCLLNNIDLESELLKLKKICKIKISAFFWRSPQLFLNSILKRLIVIPHIDGLFQAFLKLKTK
jgi:hypothetical protein